VRVCLTMSAVGVLRACHGRSVNVHHDGLHRVLSVRVRKLPLPCRVGCPCRPGDIMSTVAPSVMETSVGTGDRVCVYACVFPDDVPAWEGYE
jgi:hypothetical protein